MQLTYFLLVAATLVALTNGSALSVTAPSDESRTNSIKGPIGQGHEVNQQKFLRALETNDLNDENADEEERLSLGSVKKIISGEGSVLKKMSPAAIKKAMALQKQAKLEKLLTNDDYILKVVKKAIEKEDDAAALMKGWSMYPKLTPVLNKMTQNEEYMKKVLNVWKRGGVPEKKLFNALDIANVKSHTTIYHRYADLIKKPFR